MYQEIPELVYSDLKDIVSTMLLADRIQLPFVGKAAIKVQLGRIEVLQEVWIADIGLEWILSRDFMQRLECKLLVDKGRYRLILPEGSVAPHVNTIRLNPHAVVLQWAKLLWYHQGLR